MVKIHLIEGGEGSGNFGHEGRRGEVGGSARSASSDGFMVIPTQGTNIPEFLKVRKISDDVISFKIANMVFGTYNTITKEFSARQKGFQYGGA